MSRLSRMLVTKEDESRIGLIRLLVTRYQRRWRACNADPSHAFCQRRLKREWRELTGDLRTHHHQYRLPGAGVS